ncbi:two-component system sensor histidine kinase NtrB [Jeongeupia naejangsanensis]|uniref:histidine kinase n=1 Tax=Jeongeupia naejangsanensis TaxID=613195 RepID=A0ABS2BPP4_9NEIS|nr:ATP-binding protein [Jeongeupia naejangsanensis]MBM3117597.1 histidine kinase [Jeongeupia naejangsanensis]
MSGRGVFPSEAHWRSLALFNVFRLLAAMALFFSISWRVWLTRSGDSYDAFIALALTDVTLSVLFAIGIHQRRPAFQLQLSVQAVTDIAFLVVLMHLLGGIKSGLGILLLPYLAAAGLISRGRMTLFHAAVASLALLGEQVVQLWLGQAGTDEFFVPALLCTACFAVAWLAHRLAGFASESEALAHARGVDLENLGQLNARILQDVSDGVIVVDAHGQLRQFNAQAQRLIDAPLVAGQALGALPVLAKALKIWRADPAAPTPLLQLEGAYKTLRPRFVPLGPDPQGSVLVYLEDMDRLRREAQQLKLAALGRLTANLAHEIRNPLGAISHAGQLLREEAGDNLLMQKLTRIIGDNSRRLERMVKDVLELNRRDRVDMRPIMLEPWLTAFVDEFSQSEQIRTPIVVVCPDKAEIRFDPGHLHQVLWNLLRNGWRYCSKRPDSLIVSVASNDGRWQLNVDNDGPPVARDALTQLFEPFFTTESKGTGLGLYIAREICAANAARLEYVSQPAEAGVRFRIVFGMNDGQETP